MDKEQFEELMRQLEELNNTLESVDARLADIKNDAGLVAYIVQMQQEKQK